MIEANKYYDWFTTKSPLEKIFWISFILGLFLFLILHFIQQYKKSRNISPLSFESIKNMWQKKYNLTIYYVLYGLAFFGATGLFLLEIKYRGKIFLLALIVGIMMTLIIFLINQYFMIRYNNPKQIIKSAANTQGEITKLVPAKKTGFGKVKVKYMGTNIIYDCVTSDTENLSVGQKISVLQSDDNDVLLVTKYF